MRRVLMVALCMVAACVVACSQVEAAKILSVTGDVSVIKAPEAVWQKAKVDMSLDQGDQIKTGRKSECIVAFDEAMKDVMTMRENSQVTVEAVIPGRVNLAQGRVFALIRDLKSIQKFEVRTPTATAGARGSGLGVGTQDNGTKVSCFEDKIYVQGLDANGNVTGEQELSDGFGVEVGAGGQIGQPFELGSEDLREWNGAVSDIGGATTGTAGGETGETGGADTGAAAGTAGDSAALSDLKDDTRRGSQEDNTTAARGDKEEGANMTPSGSINTTGT